jgi:ribonuclease P protein component
MDQRFTKDERLRLQKEIDAVYAGGRRWHGRWFRIHVKPNALPHSRLGISIPKRVCGAVGRNRWKRLLRESFRLNKAAIGPGLDLIAVPTRHPEDLRRADVEQALLDLVRRARIAGAPR